MTIHPSAADVSVVEEIDASGCIVMPGLINAHQHHWYSLFKGIADGLLLEDWLYTHGVPDRPTSVWRSDAARELFVRHGDAGDRHDVFAQSFRDRDDPGHRSSHH